MNVDLARSRNRLQSHRATLSDVARRAGVSTATVSRVINRPDDVSALMQARVQEAIAAVNYVPHGAARALASQRSHTVGAIVPTLSNAIFATGLQAFEECLDEAGYTLLVALSKYDSERELRHVRSLISRGVDGMMLIGQSASEATYELIRSTEIPYVTTWSYASGGPHPCVGFNNRLAAYRLARYLVEIGHRQIAMIAGVGAHNDRAKDRVLGVCDALREAGIGLPKSRLIERPYEIVDGREALGLLMQASDPPTAVICGNDVLAMGALFECHSLGIEVPATLSIAGFDDLPLVRHLSPSLTTMAVPSEQMGYGAAGYLLARFSDVPVAHYKELDADLIVRETTGSPRATET